MIISHDTETNEIIVTCNHSELARMKSANRMGYQSEVEDQLLRIKRAIERYKREPVAVTVNLDCGQEFSADGT